MDIDVKKNIEPLDFYTVDTIARELSYCKEIAENILSRVSKFHCIMDERAKKMESSKMWEEYYALGEEWHTDMTRCRDIVCAMSQLDKKFYDTCAIIARHTEFNSMGEYIDPDTSEVCAALVGKAICVFTPALPPDLNYSRRTRYSHTYTTYVQHLITKILRGQSPGFRNQFLHKHIEYYFVVPSSKAFLIDTDNYDTKAITDAITELFPGGDSADSCSFFYKTHISDSVKEGVYILVHPAQNWGEAPQILDEFHSNFVSKLKPSAPE